jgi:2-polyprenyl-3-methyl-5-hydroxy-6-metoxy-1,4-benzoquinol methylase
MITQQACPHCARNAWQPFITTRNLRTTREPFNIVACPCGMLATLPRPDDDALGAYYDPSGYDSHKESATGIKDYLYNAVRNWSIKTKYHWVSSLAPESSWLDFGCGTGEVLAYAQQRGWSVGGVEPGSSARATALKKHGLTLWDTHHDAWKSSGPWGAITLFHVLEHLPAPEQHLAQFHRMLHAEGWLIIAVPNPESPDAQYYGADWAAWDVPLHLWHFRPAVLQSMVEQHGFKLLKTKPMWFDAPYVSALSEGHRGASAAFPKGILRGLLSNVHAQWGKNTSSLVYFFKKQH